MTKGIIYEVKLIDWIERIDLEANGNLLKTYIQKPITKEWEHPNDIDEITFSLKVYYNKDDAILYQIDNKQTTMADSDLTLTLRKVLESMKRHEHSVVEVKTSFI